MNKITDADLDNALDLPFLIVRKIAISYWKPERESQCLFGTIHAFFSWGCFLMKKEKGFALLLFGILIAKGNFWYVGLIFGIIGLFIVLIK